MYVPTVMYGVGYGKFHLETDYTDPSLTFLVKRNAFVSPNVAVTRKIKGGSFLYL